MGGPNPRQSRDAATMSKTTTIKITRRIITSHLSCLDTTATMRRSTTLHRIVPVAGAPPRAVGFHRTFRRLASISFIPFISMPACPHMTPKAAPPPATTSSIPLVLSARSFPGSRSVIYPAFPRWRPEQAGLAYVLDGEHADELSFLGDRQRPETALLQGGKSLLEKGSLRRDGGNTRLHQLTHACVPLRGVGCGHDLLTRDHADEVPILVHDGEVFLVAVDHRVQHLPEGVVGRNGFGVRLGTHDVRDTKAARLLPLSDHLGLSVRAEEDEDGDEGEKEVATEQPYEEEDQGEQLPVNRSVGMRGSAPSRRPTPKKIGASTTFTRGPARVILTSSEGFSGRDSRLETPPMGRSVMLWISMPRRWATREWPNSCKSTQTNSATITAIGVSAPARVPEAW